MGVLHLHSNYVAITLNHTEDRSLRLGRTTLSLCSLLGLVLVVAVLLEVWAVWFKKKSYDGSLMMQNFYGQPENSIDLLCIGSSHAFIDINTGVLWDEYGIPSYVLGGSLQPFWNTYYNLQEAVKTQTPRLVVLQ